MRLGRQLRWLLLGVLTTTGPYALANPDGATVVNGTASFTRPNANTLNIHNSRNAIINWNRFNIGKGQTTNFIQPGSNSAVLNRVLSNNPSQIYGNLNSNGKVFLVNQHGLMIGAGASINTAGFYGSTLNITNEDFLKGKLNFEGGGYGGIVNRGYIHAGPGGNVVLIAPDIENGGVIEVEDGNVVLAAGESIRITSLNDASIEFDVQSNDDNSLINLGSIIAKQGAAHLFAGNLKHSGSINATGLVRNADGSISLVANTTAEITGDLIAGGDEGGRITVEADTINVTGNALVSASGPHGGGTILIGGDRQGLNPDVRNATSTTVGPHARVQADATDSGDGGKVILFAENDVHVHGTVTARGGSQGGDGGFIETSGLQALDITRAPDAGAANGAGGEWLIDPFTITIQDTGPDSGITGGPSPTPLVSNATAVLTTGTIETALNNGTSVTVTTGGTDGDGQGNGDIIVSNDINKTGGADASLTLTAHNDININADITSISGIMNIFLDADSDSLSGGEINLGTTTLDANGGTVDASAESFFINGGVATINSTLSVQVVTLNSGAFTLNDDSTMQGAFTLNGGTFVNNGTLTMDGAGGVFDFSGGTLQNGTLAATAGGSAVITQNSTLDNVTLDTDLLVDNGFTLTLLNGLDFGGSAPTITLGGTGAGNMTFVDDQTLGATGSGNVVLANAGSRINDNSNSNRTYVIGSGVNISGFGQIQTGATTSFFDNQGTISANVSGQSLTLRRVNNTSGTLDVSNSGLLNLDDGSGIGTLVNDGSGTTTLTGQLINTGNTITLSPTTGDIFFDNGGVTDGTLASSGVGQFLMTTGNGTLDGVTLDTNLLVDNGQTLTVQNGLDFGVSAPTITLGGTGAGNMTFVDDQTLGATGSGNVVLANAGSRINDNSNSNRTYVIGSGVNISGFGQIQTGATTSFFDNQGTISANVSGQSLTLRRVNNTSGTLDVSNSGLLNLDDGSGIGTLVNDGSGTTTLTGQLINTGNTITLSPTTGDIFFDNGGVTDGTLASSGVGQFLMTTGNGTLDGVTLDTNLLVDNGQTLTVQNGLDFGVSAPTITLGGTGAGNMTFVDDQTLGATGSGNVVLANAGSRINDNSNSNRTYVIGSGVNISGFGQIQTGATTSFFDNQGTISANVSGQSLTLRRVNNTSGTLDVSNSGLLNLDDGSGIGTLVNDGSGTTTLTGQLINTGNTITLSPTTGDIFFDNGGVTDGTLASSGVGQFLMTTGNGTLDGVTLDTNLLVDNGQTLTVQNGLDFGVSAPTITLGGTGAGNMTFVDDQTLGATGSGNVVLANAGSRINDNSNSNRTYVIGSGVNISGFGQIQTGATTSFFDNQGTISANVSGQSLTLRRVNNTSGTLDVSNSGLLNLDDGSGIGTLVNDGSGTTTLTGQLINTGNTITLSPTTGDIFFDNGGVTDGTLASSGVGQFLMTTGNGTLDGVTLDTNLLVDNGQTLTVQNGLDFGVSAPTITLGGTGAGNMTFVDDQTLGATGSGNVVLANAGSRINDNSNSNRTYVIGSGVNISGFGQIQTGATTSFFDNQGTISANVSGQSLTLRRVNNTSGTLDSSNGAILSLTVNSLANDGTINVSTGSTLTTNNIVITNNVGGIIQGSGTFNVGTASLDNDGTIRPGGLGVVGGLTITGDFNNTGSIEIELYINAGSGVAGTDYDLLAIDGQADLQGTLVIGNQNSSTSAGDIITPITYTSAVNSFSTIDQSDGIFGSISSNALSMDIDVLFVADKTWDGGGAAGDWFDALNWNLNTLPASSDNVGISFGGPVSFNGTEVINSLFSTQDLVITGGTLTIGGSTASTISGDLILADGTLTTSGDITVTGAINWNPPIIGFTETFTLDGPGLLIADGGFNLGTNLDNNDTLILNKFLIINESTGGSNWDDFGFGTLSITGTGVIDNFDLIAVNAITTVSSAELTVAVPVTNSGEISKENGTGKLAFSGSLSVTGGNLNVAAGTTVEVTGTPLFLANGGELGGGGTFIGDVSSTGGIIDIEDSDGTPGTLSITGNVTFDAHSSVVFDVVGPGDFDVLDITGDLNLSGGYMIAVWDTITPVDITATLIMTSGSIFGGFTNEYLPAGSAGWGGSTSISASIGSYSIDLDVDETGLTAPINFWISPSDGDWNTPANWSLGVPGVLDYVVINQDDVEVTVISPPNSIVALEAQNAIRIDSSTLTITGNSPQAIDNLLSEVTFEFSSKLNVGGTTLLTDVVTLFDGGDGGGTLEGSGNYIIHPVGGLNIIGPMANTLTTALDNYGVISGSGTLTVNPSGTLTNFGKIQPGGPGNLGILTFNGDFINDLFGTIEIEINGDGGVAGTDHDQLVVIGDADLLGTLDIQGLNGFNFNGGGSPFVPITYGSFQNGFTSIFGPNEVTLTPTYTGDVATAGELTLTPPPLLFTWADAVSGDWNVGGNWEQGTVPTIGDDAVIGFGGLDITIGANADINTFTLAATNTLTLTNGTFTIDGDTTFDGALTVSGGTLTGDGDLTLNSTFDWSGGALTGNGLLTTTAASTVSNAGGQTLSRDWTNSATGVATWSNGNLSFNSGATFTNDGTVTISGANLSLTLSSGTTFNNQNFLDVDNGTITTITSGGTFTNGAVIGVGSATTLAIQTTSGTDTGTWNIDGGLVDISGGSRTLSGGFSVASGGGGLEVSGGILAVETAAGLTLPAGLAVTVSGGTLTGAQNLVVDGSFDWTGGGITGPGLLTTNGSSDLDQAGGLTLSRNWTNAATTTWTDGNLSFNANATFTNNNTFTVNASGRNLTLSSGTTFNNQGDLDIDSVGTTTITSGGTFTNGANININGSGSILAIQTTFGTDTGTWNIAPGGLVDITGGSRTLSGGFSVLSTGGSLEVSGGTLAVETTAELTLPAGLAVTVSGGTLTGAQNLFVDGSFDWTGGGITGPGLLTTNGSSDLDQAGGLTLSRNWTNAATTTWTDGNLSFNANATFTNNNTFTVNATGRNLTLSSGTTFNNQGDLDIDSVGTTTITSGGTFTNGANININGSGSILAIQTTFGTDTGTWNIAPGGLVDITGGSRTLSGGFSVASTGGDLEVSGGILVVETTAELTLPAGLAVTVSGGTLTGEQNLVVDGSFDWTGGGITGPGSLTTNGSGSLNQAGGLTLSRDWTNGASSTITWSNGNLSFNSGATFTNDGTFTISGANVSLTLSSGTTFDNQNVLNVNNFTTTTITSGGTFTNGADIDVGSSTTLAIQTTFGTDTGTWNIGGDDGRIDITGGSRTLSGGFSVVSDGGDLELSGGILAVETVGPLTLPAGLAVTVSGGTLTGTPALFVDGSFAWTGGAISGSGLITTTGTSTFNNAGGLTIARNWNNSGTIDWTAGALAIGSSKTLTNTGTFNSNAGASFGFNATNTFDNQNLLNVNSDTTFNGSGTFTNSGTITTTATNTLSIATAGIDTGTWTIGGGSISIIGSTRTINDSFSLTSTTGSLNLNVGIINFNTTAAFTLPSTLTLNVSGGTLGGTADILVNSPLNWTGGAISGSGLITTTGTSTFNNAGGLTIARNWNNSGTINWTTGALAIGSSKTLTNTGTFNADAGASFGFNATNTFDNQNLLNVNSNTTFSGSGTFINGGSAQLIVLADTSIQPTVFTQNGTLLLNGGDITVTTLDNAGTLRGSGTINGDVTNTSLVQPGGLNSAGFLTITGNFTQGPTGLLEIELESTVPASPGNIGSGFHDQLAVSGIATLDGTVTIAPINSFPLQLAEYVYLTFGSSTGDFSLKQFQAGFSAPVTIATQQSITFTNSSTVYFTNANTNGLWADPGNWNNSGALPDSLDDVDLFSLNSDDVFIASGPHTVNSLVSDTIQVFNVDALFTVNGTADFGSGEFLHTNDNGPTTIFNGTVTAFDISNDFGTMTFNDGANSRISNDATLDLVGTFDGDLLNVGFVTLDNVTVINGTWDNDSGGFVDWFMGDFVLQDSSFNNNGGDFEANVNADIVLSGSFAVFDNNGGNLTINASTLMGGTGSGDFFNSGNIVINNGSLLEINIDGGVDTGSWDLGTGSISFTGGFYDIDPGFIDPVGTSGTVIVDGGLVSVNTGGTLAFSVGVDLELTSFGSLDSSNANIIVEGSFYADEGSLFGSGLTFTTNGTTTLTSSGSTALELGMDWVNNGDVTWDSGSLDFFDATLTNSGNFIANANDAINEFGTSGFVNAGSAEFVVNTDTTFSLFNFTQNGTLTFNGATLTIPSLLNGGTLQGDGTVDGNLTNTGTIAPGGSGTVGTLFVTGDLVLNFSGSVEFELEDTISYDQIDVTGQATLDGSLDLIALSGYTPLNNDTFQLLLYGTNPGSTEFASLSWAQVGTESISTIANTTGSYELEFTILGGVTWVGTLSGGDGINWFNLLNWDGGAVPLSGDDAVIPGGGFTVDIGGITASDAVVGSLSLGAGSTLTISNQNMLTIENDSTLNGILELADGDVDLASGVVLTIAGTLDWTLGQIGTSSLNSTLVTTVGSVTNAEEPRLKNLTWNNAGTVHWVPTTPGVDFVLQGSDFNNSGITNLRNQEIGQGIFEELDAPPSSFNNLAGGTFNIDPIGATNLRFDAPVNNDGDIFIISNQAILASDSSNAGRIDIPGSSALSVNNFTNLTLLPGNTLTGTGSLQLQSDSALIVSAPALLPSGMNLFADNATLDLAADLSIDGSVDLIESSLTTGNGSKLIVNPGGTLNLDGDVQGIGLGADVINNGFTYWISGELNSERTFFNNGDFEIQNLSSVSYSGETGVFNNSGTLFVTNSTLIDIFIQYVDAGGTLDIGSLSSFGLGGVDLVLNSGHLIGNGTFEGHVINNGGVINPGGQGSTGILTINGNLDNFGVVEIDIGEDDDSQAPLVAGADYDQLVVTQDANLGGTLVLTGVDGFTFSNNGASFNQVITYASRTANTFGTITTIGSETIIPTYTGDLVTPGDFSFLMTFSGDFIWTGLGGDTSWDNAGNWNFGIPGVGNDVVIPFVASFPTVEITGAEFAASLSLASGATLSINGGSLFVSEDSTLDGLLDLQNGGLDIGGTTLTLNGGVDLANTSAISNGTVNLSSTAAMNLTGTSSILDNLTFNNAGTVIAASTLTLQNDTVFNNGGVYDFTDDVNITLGTGAASFNNLDPGQIRKTGGTGISAIDAAITTTNDGSVGIDSGELDLNLANWTLGSGDVLSGTGIYKGNVTNSAGRIRPGNLGGQGTDGTLRINGLFDNGPGGVVEIDFNSRGNDELLANDVTLDGTVQVSLSVVPQVSDSTRVVSCQGTCTDPDFASIVAPPGITFGQNLQEDGLDLEVLAVSFSWTGSDGNWNNPANWSLGFVPDASVDVVLPNVNLVITDFQEVNSLALNPGATLTLNGGAASLGIGPGGLTVASGATLTNSGGTLLNSSVADIDGGFANNSGVSTFSDNVTVAGDFAVAGGAVNLSGGSTLNGSLGVSGGTLGFGGASADINGPFNMSAGIVAFDASQNRLGGSNNTWSGGTWLTNEGSTLVMQPGSTLDVGGSGPKLLRGVDSTFTLDMTEGDINMSGSGSLNLVNAVIDNTGGTSFFHQGNGALIGDTSSQFINNGGLFENVSGTATILVDFVNDGGSRVNVLAGTLLMQDTDSADLGAYRVDSGASLIFAANRVLLGSLENNGSLGVSNAVLVMQGSLTNNGRIQLANGTLNLAGQTLQLNNNASLGGSGVVQGNVINNGLLLVGGAGAIDDLEIQGNYQQNPNGVLVVEVFNNGSETQTDQLTVTGATQLNGGALVIGFTTNSLGLVTADIRPLVLEGGVTGNFARVIDAGGNILFINFSGGVFTIFGASPKIPDALIDDLIAFIDNNEELVEIISSNRSVAEGVMKKLLEQDEEDEESLLVCK